MGNALAEAGSAAMNDDDLPFPIDDLERWKRGEQPDGWLDDQHEALQARCRAQIAKLRNLLASAARRWFDV